MNIIMRPRTRERGGEAPALSSFLKRPSCFPRTHVFFFFLLADQIISQTVGKKLNVFTCNIEILVNSFPCFLLRLCFIFFLSQCSLLQCDIKAFNKRQCLTVCTNLVKASISVYVFKYHQCKAKTLSFFPVFDCFLENTDTFILAR